VTDVPPDDLGLGVDEDRLTLAAYIEDICLRHPEREALVFGQDRISYGGLLAHVRALAKSLIAAGVSKGTKVGILVANRPEFVIGSFATSLAGGVIVPISTLATAAEREHIVRHSDASLLIMQGRLRKHDYLAQLEAGHPELFTRPPGRLVDPHFPFLRRIVAVGPTRGVVEGWDRFMELGQSVSDSLLDAAAGEVTVADDAIIVYTSGTTALPKAVLHTHRSVTVQMWRWGLQLGLGAKDRVWSAMPFFWTAGFSMLLGGTLSSGSTLVLQEVFEPAAALELIERERITTLHSLEHTDAQLASHPDARVRDLSSLTYLRQTSSLRTIIGPGDGTWDTQSGYGGTETFTISTALPAFAPEKIRSSCHGLPLPGMRIRIVDPETGQTMDAGQTGEIVVKGVTLMRGYYKLPAEAAFDADGWFHTCDAGYFDDAGYLHWSGRISRLIKTAGANVSPIEVESRAAGLKMLGVTCAVGIAHPTLGEAVVLAGIPLEGVEFDEARLRDYLRQHLASYKVPKRILLFDEGELDFTSNEKVRAEQVRRLVIDRLIGCDRDQEWVAYLHRQRGADRRSTSAVGASGAVSQHDG
jgi:acyl-CoA synthetase (AMP-forming)/AMP-acid ligase II